MRDHRTGEGSEGASGREPGASATPGKRTLTDRLPIQRKAAEPAAIAVAASTALAPRLTISGDVVRASLYYERNSVHLDDANEAGFFQLGKAISVNRHDRVVKAVLLGYAASDEGNLAATRCARLEARLILNGVEPEDRGRVVEAQPDVEPESAAEVSGSPEEKEAALRHHRRVDITITLAGTAAGKTAQAPGG